MIHQIWFVMIVTGMACGALQGKGSELMNAAVGGCAKAITVSMELCAGYMYFCGLMKIAAAFNAGQGMSRVFAPVLQKLMPGIRASKTREAAAMNLAMNMLGMGNAATPVGLEAMRGMETERKQRPGVKHDMEMLLILNATGLQLIPTTVLTLRAAAGSAKAEAVLLPTLACTALSTVTGVAGGWICRKIEEGKHG